MNDKTIEEIFEYCAAVHKEILIPNRKDIAAILARAEQEAKEEPLAVLAERRNCWIDTHQNRNLLKRINLLFYQQTTNGPIREPIEFRGKTYAECESKARAYLSSLKDVKQEEGR